MRKVLLLHGNRQTGELLLGRMSKLQKKLKAMELELDTLDAPFRHSTDDNVCTWWNRNGNVYEGLEESIQLIKSHWSANEHIGLLGFSQGSRLVHLLCILHQHSCTNNSNDTTVVTDNDSITPGLKFVIMASGYDAPLPTSSPLFASTEESLSDMGKDLILQVPSLHIWGQKDQLIHPEQSQAVLKYYHNPQTHIHEGGHHVPMKAESVRSYLSFIEAVMSQAIDPEILEQQRDEVEAMEAMFMDEFQLLSDRDDEKGVYQIPIRYQLRITQTEHGTWPPKPITLRVAYPSQYPERQGPILELVHENNGLDFTSSQSNACYRMIKEAIEPGIPSILNCLYSVREYFESGAMREHHIENNCTEEDEEEGPEEQDEDFLAIMAASPERIQKCNLQGLQIAQSLLTDEKEGKNDGAVGSSSLWKYTIGLVGKPSAGKSTFFNTATGFARQRQQGKSDIGGAKVARHPFTTIDPNIGFCLVPAPPGACPEEGREGKYGSTHGRDYLGRRLLPVLLKDVAGLVPGAYQGRGRGNQFLNDLTDADVIIHVIDASGMSDEQGNVATDQCVHPLYDMAWIRDELIEWVFTNVARKWDTIRRKGKTKLAGMFSGYGQKDSMTLKVLHAVDLFVENSGEQVSTLDEWDAGDLHRLVSAFLAVRFPFAIALNKADLPCKTHVEDIRKAIPIHGAFVSTPLSARNEMEFMRTHLLGTLTRDTRNSDFEEYESRATSGTMQCLQSAMSLKEPLLVFPVSEFVSYAPLPGLTRVATKEQSLPNPGMVNAITERGGTVPSHYNALTRQYTTTTSQPTALRDVLMMKPGSTVEDVYLVLKNMGAFSGEFVRAEAAGEIGEDPNPIPKHTLLDSSSRILKIMTNKRASWQSTS